MWHIRLLFIVFTFLSYSSWLYAQQVSLESLTIAQCLNLAREKEVIGDKREASRFLNQAGTLEWENRNFAQAINHFEKSIRLNVDIGNENGISMLNNNLGLIYSDVKDFEKSIEHFNKTLQYRRKAGEKENMISCLINLSVVSNNLKRYEQSATYLSEALGYARELNNAEQMRSCYGMLSETYEKSGNSNESRHYFDLYRTFHEKEQQTKEREFRSLAEKAQLEALLTEEKKKLTELELSIRNQELQEKSLALSVSDKSVRNLTQNLSKQELAIKVLNQEAEARNKDAQIKDLKIKEINANNRVRAEREQFIRYALLAGVGILGILGLFIWTRYREKTKTNQKLSTQNAQILSQQSQIIGQKQKLEHAFAEIQEKNEDITASITYARRIQKAMLASSEQHAQHLQEHFILWKPRDIVSGDFFWTSRIEISPTHHKLIIAAADCTGHGVPGAFMSMIGDSLLNQIVHDKGIHEADLILNELHLGVKNMLNQQQTENKDGMDITLVVIDSASQTMQFAGANNPLYYIQKGELQQIKGNKFGIGGYTLKQETEERIFTKHIIQLFDNESFSKIDTTFYLFSDGYQDQFGGPNRGKFMTKRFREMLFAIHHQSLTEQKAYLDQVIEDWKKVGNSKQTDDILVIGAKI
ncbi:MAG: SpoIIE family protein phosphatase [Microscillaceae bacterium]|jgi:serine phosphatase RsbU (regulator of sigma subunit)|nr:SpoIIE family protein phosphatase [Microscillaceae bacterium]